MSAAKKPLLPLLALGARVPPVRLPVRPPPVLPRDNLQPQMKSAACMFPAVAVSTPGLFFALVGCANAPTRLSTTEADTSPAMVATAGANYEAPVPVRTVRPQFPFEMRSAGISGDVHLKCLIDTDGVVRDAQVMKSSAPEFNQPALEAIKRWTFTAARQDGVSVAQWVMIPMVFHFTDS